MSTAATIILRYLVTYLCGLLVSHGWSVAALDGPTLDAVTTIVGGILGAVAMGAIGVWTSTVERVLARLKARHKPALVAAATEVVTAQPALATAAVPVP